MVIIGTQYLVIKWIKLFLRSWVGVSVVSFDCCFMLIRVPCSKFEDRKTQGIQPEIPKRNSFMSLVLVLFYVHTHSIQRQNLWHENQWGGGSGEGRVLGLRGRRLVACPGPLSRGGTEPPPAMSVVFWWLAAVYFYGDCPSPNGSHQPWKCLGGYPGRTCLSPRGSSWSITDWYWGKNLAPLPQGGTTGWCLLCSRAALGIWLRLMSTESPLCLASPLPHPTSCTVLQVSLEITSAGIAGSDSVSREPDLWQCLSSLAR